MENEIIDSPDIKLGFEPGRHKFYRDPKIWYKLFNCQKGRCAICGIHQADLKRALCLDHDHKTGKVRGLLCYNCNFLIGNAKDNIGTLQRAIKYLENK
jgi:hypothetical protein